MTFEIGMSDVKHDAIYLVDNLQRVARVMLFYMSVRYTGSFFPERNARTTWLGVCVGGGGVSGRGCGCVGEGGGVRACVFKR